MIKHLKILRMIQSGTKPEKPFSCFALGFSFEGAEKIQIHCDPALVKQKTCPDPGFNNRVYGYDMTYFARFGEMPHLTISSSNR